MKRISSRATRLHKRVFPSIWFGFFVLFLAVGVLGGAARKEPVGLIVPVVMAVVLFFVMKKLCWDFVDEVIDCGGDCLLVKNRGIEDRIPLSNIMNVSSSILSNPRRVTLRLVRPSKLGNEIVFCPAGFAPLPFAPSEVAEDLMTRAYRARPTGGTV